MKAKNECTQSKNHQHRDGHIHGPDCGHPAVKHDGHVDYLVDGHLHHPGDRACECHGPKSR
ncbi:MAG TPA: hypothetical protein VFB62_26345 [Polyangiaceae bacterium]|jgi:hypothetical protein|nr:hypothetical protein [Polyangiaceae bacterium]